MSTWILLLSWYTAKGVAMESVEFNSQAACEVAGTAWKSNDAGRHSKYICVSKGGKT